MLNRALSYLVAVVVATGVIACGGSSSDDAAIVQPPPAHHLPITSDNATDITADVIGAISFLFDVIGVADVTNLPFPDVPVTGQNLGIAYDGPFSGIDLLLIGESGPYSTRSVVVDEGNCDTGTFTNTWDDADDNLEVSTGDTMDISFADCFFTDLDVSLAGEAFVTGIDIMGDVSNEIPPWSLAANFAFLDLVGTDSAGAVTINGNFDVAVSTTDGLDLNLEISGSQLTAVEDGSTETLSDFSVTEVFDLVTQTITVDASGTLTSDWFNGSVSFETPTSLVIFGSDDNPSSGEIMITHSSSSVRATVIDNISVQLSIDEDGDGTAETTLTVTWLDLDVD